MSYLTASHAIVATLALLLGIYQFTRPKGTKPHKYIGRIWVVGLLYVSIGSFFITKINPGSWSAIHLISVFTLISIPWSFYLLRKGDIKGHKYSMLGITCGVFVAGILAFVPSREIPNLFRIY